MPATSRSRSEYRAKRSPPRKDELEARRAFRSHPGQSLRLAQNGYRAIAFSADGNLLAAGGSNVENAVYDLRTGAKAYALTGARQVRAITFSRSRGYGAVAGDDLS